jgi:hypothetical protein
MTGNKIWPSDILNDFIFKKGFLLILAVIKFLFNSAMIINISSPG